jgi:protein involved in polysaccharide export with SLBB domain
MPFGPIPSLCLFFVATNTLFLDAQNSYRNDPSVLRDPSGYKIRPSDRIRITVQGEPDCSAEVQVNNQGMIRLTYVGDLKVDGLNTKSLESLIVRRYQNELIFRKPKINVFITKYSERVVFLNGSVNRKGPYVFPPEVEAMNIVEVISRAGGFSDIARKNKVYVTRTIYDSNGNAQKTETYTVDVEALSKGLVKFGTKKRFWIYPGDRIQVPERLI